MPYKGLPSCENCKRLGKYAQSWKVLKWVGSRVLLECTWCGKAQFSKSSAARRMARETDFLDSLRSETDLSSDLNLGEKR